MSGARGTGREKNGEIGRPPPRAAVKAGWRYSGQAPSRTFFVPAPSREDTMARLSAFKVDSKKIESGEWVKPGEDWDDLEILTRGHTDKFIDSQAGRLRRAAKSMGGETEKLSLAIKRAVLIDCLIEFCLLDVRGLSDDEGNKITFDQFTELLRSGDYPSLVTAAIFAAAQVGNKRSAEIEEAVKNLSAPSEPTSNGVASDT